jgi:hypothetical protein
MKGLLKIWRFSSFIKRIQSLFKESKRLRALKSGSTSEKTGNRLLTSTFTSGKGKKG